MSTAPDQIRKHRLSVDAYHRMAETGVLPAGVRTELIDGEVFDTPPIGSPHAGLVNRLTELLSSAAAGKAIVSVQNPIVLGGHSEPEPDLCLLRRRDDFYAGSHPRADDALLVIEVADSSVRHDREIKLALYARHGIPEVWLADIAARTLHVFRTPDGDGYRERSTPDPACPLALPELAIDPAGLF